MVEELGIVKGNHYLVYFKMYLPTRESRCRTPMEISCFFVTQGNRCNALELFICSKGHPALPSPALVGSHDIKSVVYCGEIAHMETKS